MDFFRPLMTLMQAAGNIFPGRRPVIDLYEPRNDDYGLGTAPMAAKQSGWIC
jgi:hypothetical protein